MLIMHIAWLGLGTNLGDKKKNLESAIAAIGTLGYVRKVSSIYKSRAWGYESQHVFYNLCMEISTSLDPSGLLTGLKGIENQLGRNKSGTGYSDRIIDVDILIYDNLLLSTGDLTIPHPHLHERNFVLFPLVEIAPLLEHPILKRTIRELKDVCEDDVMVTRVMDL